MENVSRGTFVIRDFVSFEMFHVKRWEVLGWAENNKYGYISWLGYGLGAGCYLQDQREARTLKNDPGEGISRKYVSYGTYRIYFQKTTETLV